MATFRESISRFIIGKNTLSLLRPDLQDFVREEIKKEQGLQILKAKAEALPVLGTGISQYAQQPRTKPQTGISFQALRDFSLFYWAARACITKRQEQIANLGWGVAPVDDEDDSDRSKQQSKELERFFKDIGGPNKTFRHLLDQAIDDLLTLDAMALYRVRENGGSLKYLHPIDGATVRIVTDAAGRTPLPPAVAYEQWVKGQKVADLTTDDLIYGMMNPRTASPYGLSPLESLVMSVQSALRSEASNLAILQEGNVPEGFYVVPEGWTPDQIKQYDEYFTAIVAGDVAQQRRMKPLPGGSKVDAYIPTKKPTDMEFREFEKWLAVKTCAMFGVSPQSIGLTWDVNKATAQEQTLLTQNESVKPLANFLEEIFNRIIQVDLGMVDFKFSFQGFDARNEQTEAEVNTKYLATGVYTVNEVRAKIGEQAVEGGDLRTVQTPSGPVPLIPEAQPEQPVDQPPPTPVPPEQQSTEQQKSITPLQELRRWQRKALNDIGKGRSPRPFVVEVLDDQVAKALQQQLAGCTTADSVRSLFKQAMEEQTVNVVDAAEKLLDELLTLNAHGSTTNISLHRGA